MSDLAGITPPSIDWDADDLPNAFRRFKQYCELIFKGPLSAKTEAQHVNYLLLWVGQTGLDIYNTWTFANAADAAKLDKIWEKFQKHIEPKSNPRLARYKLKQMKQSQKETVDDFMTKCRTIADKCIFRDDQEKEERLI